MPSDLCDVLRVALVVLPARAGILALYAAFAVLRAALVVPHAV